MNKGKKSFTLEQFTANFDAALDSSSESPAGQTAIGATLIGAVIQYGLPVVEAAIDIWIKTRNDDERQMRKLNAVASFANALEENASQRLAESAIKLLNNNPPLAQRRRLYRILELQGESTPEWITMLGNDIGFIKTDPADWMRVRRLAGYETAEATFKNRWRLLRDAVVQGIVQETTIKRFWPQFVVDPRQQLGQPPKVTVQLKPNSLKDIRSLRAMLQPARKSAGK